MNKMYFSHEILMTYINPFLVFTNDQLLVHIKESEYHVLYELGRVGRVTNQGLPRGVFNQLLQTDQQYQFLRSALEKVFDGPLHDHNDPKFTEIFEVCKKVSVTIEDLITTYSYIMNSGDLEGVKESMV